MGALPRRIRAFGRELEYTVFLKTSTATQITRSQISPPATFGQIVRRGALGSLWNLPAFQLPACDLLRCAFWIPVFAPHDHALRILGRTALAALVGWAVPVRVCR